MPHPAEARDSPNSTDVAARFTSQYAHTGERLYHLKDGTGLYLQYMHLIAGHLFWFIELRGNELELAFLEAYDAAGAEGQELPDEQELRTMSRQRLCDARPIPAACLRLFALKHPVHKYWLAVRRAEQPRLPRPAETCVAVGRRDLRTVQ